MLVCIEFFDRELEMLLREVNEPRGYAVDVCDPGEEWSCVLNKARIC